MGSIVANAAENAAESMQNGMKKTMEANGEAMINNQKKMAMQRREIQMAVMLARSRDMFHWYSAFTGTAAVLLTAGAIKKRNPALLGPLLPLSFINAFQYDLCYGSKLLRIRNEAGEILAEKWKLPDEENPFLLPENNLLINRMAYHAYMRREQEQ